MLKGEPKNTNDIAKEPKDRDFRKERRIIDQDSGTVEKKKINGFKVASLEICVLFHMIKKKIPMPSIVVDILKCEKL